MFPISNCLEIERRARLVLDVNKNATKAEMRDSYHKQILKHHPDVDGTPVAGEITSLIASAYRFIIGRTNDSHLLEDDALVSLAIGTPLSMFKDDSRIPESYEHWAKDKFFDFINPRVSNENTAI